MMECIVHVVISSCVANLAHQRLDIREMYYCIPVCILFEMIRTCLFENLEVGVVHLGSETHGQQMYTIAML